MISVIIPVYNAEKFIDKLINSIIIQSLDITFFEIIFVDNNSTDKTKEIIQNFIKNSNFNIKYLKYTEKQSSYASRNYGFNNSKGDILAFTDADCILAKNYLLKIWNFYQEKSNKSIILSGHVEMIVNDRQNLWEIFDKTGSLQNKRLASKNKIVTANLIVPRKIFNSVGNFLEISSTADHEWSTRAANKHCNIKYKEDIIVYHPTRKSFKEIKNKMTRISGGYGEISVEFRKNLFLIIFISFLKIFYIVTNIRISRKIIKDVGIIKVFKFNFYFQLLRLYQFFGVIKGIMRAKRNNNVGY